MVHHTDNKSAWSRKRVTEDVQQDEHRLLAFKEKPSHTHAHTLTNVLTCSFRFCQRPHGLSSKISLSSSLSSSFPSDPDFLSGTDIVIFNSVSYQIPTEEIPPFLFELSVVDQTRRAVTHRRAAVCLRSEEPPSRPPTPAALSPLGAQNILQRNKYSEKADVSSKHFSVWQWKATSFKLKVTARTLWGRWTNWTRWKIYSRLHAPCRLHAKQLCEMLRCLSGS